MEKFKVTPTVEERKALEHLVSVGKAAARKLAHARILLLADEGPGGPRRSDGDMIEALQVSPSTIARVREAVRDRGLRGRPRASAPAPATGEGEAHRLHREAIDPIGL